MTKIGLWGTLYYSHSRDNTVAIEAKEVNEASFQSVEPMHVRVPWRDA